MKQTKILKIIVTGTEQDIKEQFKLLNSYVNTEIVDLTDEFRNLKFAIDEIINENT